MNKLLIVSSALLLCSSVTYAASQDECSIWLCAPAGFPGSECSAAHSAFIHRIKHGKSPFPSFSSCSESMSGNADDPLDVKTGYAAFIPAHKERQCIEWSEYRSAGYTGYSQQCLKYQEYTVPDKYVDGRPCLHGNQGGTDPKGCTQTYYSIKVIDKSTGQQIGDTYFYNY